MVRALSPDAVVIGAGPNGLVAANMLADAGWSVVVLEAQSTPGGAVRSGEITAPHFLSDLYSAFYPLAAVSRPIRDLHLESHGLRWAHAPEVLANPTLDGPTALLSRSLDDTAASLDRFCPGDGTAWRALFHRWLDVGNDLVDAVFTPFPPLKAGFGLARRGPHELLALARFSLLPVRRMAVEHGLGGDGASLLLAGNALHADMTPEAALGGFFGWILACIGQEHGFPVPVGGAQRLTDALVARLENRGGRVACNSRVTSIRVEGGRAVGVELAGGDAVPARRAVVADVDAVALYLHLVGAHHLPSRALEGISRFQRALGTVKVDWALRAPIPWTDPDTRRAGTVHLASSLDELTTHGAQLACGHIADPLFLVLGQMSTADPTRSPPGTESAWAYTHVPSTITGDAGGSITGRWDATDTAAITERIESRVEAFAPGFRDLIVARHAMTPVQLEARDQNLVGGDLNGGTAQLHQQLVFRPLPGLGRAGTPIDHLYLASASAHPGGGVHGACGANAARAALAADRMRRVVGWTAAATAAGAAALAVKRRVTASERPSDGAGR